jgi:polyisoprenoid-binding protein YceI
MATRPSTPTPPVGLPLGTWRVDPNAGELVFRSRGFFGLAPVRGRFGAYEGELEVGADGVRGELRIQAATLDTGNAKRDKHLRSADFFEVEDHPTVTFTLTRVPSTPEDLAATGQLRIRDNSLEIHPPLTVTVVDDDRLQLETAISVDRAAAGVGWSKLGMIQGQAHLEAKLVLVRQS